MKRRMIITAAALVFGLGASEALFAETTTKTAIVVQDDVKYDEISTDELPEDVNTSIQEGYGDYTVSQAYKGGDGTYKAKLEKGDEKISVFFNEQGEFLKIEQDGDDSWNTDTGTQPADTSTILDDNTTTDPMQDAPVDDGTGTDGGTTDPLTP